LALRKAKRHLAAKSANIPPNEREVASSISSLTPTAARIAAVSFISNITFNAIASYMGTVTKENKSNG